MAAELMTKEGVKNFKPETLDGKFKEIIDAAIPVDDPRYVDVFNKYAEKPPSIIDKMKAE